jgi:signal transduction histidine kinase
LGGAINGLPISRAIVEPHGGRMGIEGKLGDGTRVWFTLFV